MRAVPPPQRRRVAPEGAAAASDALEGASRAQSSLDAISNEVAEQVIAIELAANARRRPLYEERARGLSAVPHFWARALMGHPLLASLASSADRTILAHCTSLDIEHAADAMGYTMTLSFDDANPYFANRMLERRVSWEDGVMTLHTSEIEWHPGRDPAALEVRGGSASVRAAAAGGESPSAAAAAAGSTKRARDEEPDGATWDEAVPLLLLLLLSDEGGDVDSDGDDEEHSLAAREVEEACAAIKDELWADPLKYYEGGIREERSGAI